MNTNIEKLYAISKKPSRLIIGLMSGTSMDGLDVALCLYEGSGFETKVKVLHFKTVDFTENVKQEIRKIFAKPTIDFQQLCILNPWIGNLHGDIVNQCLKDWNVKNEDVDLIASHGQTVYHSPKILHRLADFPNATLQIGDADHIAHKTGIITIADFRQKHCAAGGEGAPLAVYGDYLIFSKKGTDRILLNMGGISNYTFLSGDFDATKVFATDTGPGNTIIDAYVQKHFQLSYDKNAEIASKGKVSDELLEKLLANDFFEKPIPKTTGPELFNLEYLAKALANCAPMSHEDILATLCFFTAKTICDSIKTPKTDVFLSGGGMHNPLIVKHIKALMPEATFKITDEIGINADAKEAVLFATLANETVAGGQVNFGQNVPNVSMGKISFPD